RDRPPVVVVEPLEGPPQDAGPGADRLHRCPLRTAAVRLLTCIAPPRARLPRSTFRPPLASRPAGRAAAARISARRCGLPAIAARPPPWLGARPSRQRIDPPCRSRPPPSPNG